jgi:hypothetical protein
LQSSLFNDNKVDLDGGCMPLYSSKGLDKFSLKQEENNTINAEIPYQFQEKHEETLPYQEYSTNIPRIKHPRDSA